MLKIRTLLVIFMLATVSVAEGGTTVYIIKEGDTLSNLAERFYGKGILWPKIWKSNRYIDDPDLIYPNDQLTVINPYSPSGLPFVKLEPGVDLKTLKNIKPPNPIYFYSWRQSSGFVTKERWKKLGSIVSSEIPKILLGKGDRVYLNLGSGSGTRPGDKFTLFRDSALVIHPLTGKKVGYKVANIGEVEILSILDKDLSYGVITDSYREITKGVRLKPVVPYVSEVLMRKGKTRVEGVILESKNDTKLNGTGSVVYIDVGKKDNIVAGHTFSIFPYRGRTAYDLENKKTVKIPGRNIGQLVVLKAEEHISTGVITKSSGQVENGYLVVLDI